MDDDGALVLEFSRNGKATRPNIIARLAGDVLAVEAVDMTKPAARIDFARRLAEGRPGISRKEVEEQLLRTAADLASQPEPAGDQGDGLPEVQVSRIIRPERFIVAEVSGVAVPLMQGMCDNVVGKWFWYLRWADGRREKRPLASVLDLPQGGRLWVHPQPGAPAPTTRPGWTHASRERWLAGDPAPDPAELFRRLCEQIARFLDLPKPDAPGITATLALWSIFTYCYQAWPAVPYLYIGGPLGSGKSRVFEVLSRLIFRALPSSSLTAATLFRTLHTQGGTLLLDEAERLKNTQDPAVGELLSMLLAGYKRGGSATRLEPLGEGGFQPVEFQVFGPKALACVAGLPPALASRCIPVTMFRAAPGSDKPKRRIDQEPEAWEKLRDDLHALALEHGPEWLALAERSDACPSGIDGRQYELWQPLLALAAWIESAGARGLLALVQQHALAVIESAGDDQVADTDCILLRLLADAVQIADSPRPSDLLEKAKAAEPELFRKWTAKGVAEHLRRYGLRTCKTHGERRYGRLTVADLQRVQAHYGIDLNLPEAPPPQVTAKPKPGAPQVEVEAAIVAAAAAEIGVPQRTAEHRVAQARRRSHPSTKGGPTLTKLEHRVAQARRRSHGSPNQGSLWTD